MKLTCTQSELNTNLSLVNRAVPSRPTHPVLGNVLLKADAENQRVSLTAFDLSLGLQTSFNANVEADGAIAIPAKLFNDIVSRLPEGDITLEDSLSEAESDADTESLSITLTSTSGQYKMRGMNSEDFPELPQIEDGMVVKLPVEALIEGLRGSLFATSADETKQVLTGVHLMVQEDSLEFAATDGHRLAVVETLNAKPTSEESQEDEEKPASEDTISSFELTVPARTLRELERMLGLSESSDTVALQFEVGQIIFQGGNHRLTSRTLEGQYPAYRQLIPGQFQRQVAIPRRQLLSAVERIAVLADQKNNIVKFDIDAQAQTIDLTVETQDVGSARESLSAQVTGESIEIAFNVKYLIDGLKALSTSDIQFQMNAANTPVILTPLGGLKMTYLIMPVQIRD
ncbi:DNA polymerase III, beta subunit [Coleofasciculus chthonoplastes PCC 7420]|uniref:Beta sliding clamp n=1 Tax=Coleofasciculus chthonoplastes PCC 7420 TaxID=118168 RepID=B4VWR6_9CYAN|nr:DNA polymerase III subunit beta [Coleofasciculus chthonoplastes]EDX73761.1 DNA polymerase III, beta subunit [Coleofasciculus chthonoplastes PCC 7420]